MTDHAITRRSFAKGGLAASALAALSACGKNSNASSSGSGSSSSDAGSGVFTYYINDPVAIDPYNTQ